MNCRRVVNLMSAYVDGELTGMEMLEIRRHLGECPECAGEHESVRTTKLLISRLRNVTPREEFAVSLVRKLDEVRVPRYQRVTNLLSRYLHHKLSPVAAALAASGLALVIMSSGGVDQAPVVQNDWPTSMQAANSYKTPSFTSDAYTTPVSFSSEPLKLASYSADAKPKSIQFAGLATR